MENWPNSAGTSQPLMASTPEFTSAVPTTTRCCWANKLGSASCRTGPTATTNRSPSTSRSSTARLQPSPTSNSCQRGGTVHRPPHLLEPSTSLREWISPLHHCGHITSSCEVRHILNACQVLQTC